MSVDWGVRDAFACATLALVAKNPGKSMSHLSHETLD